MMRKSSELQKEDREVLLDLDNRSEAQTADIYGSIGNGSFIPSRYFSVAAADEDLHGGDASVMQSNTRSNQTVSQLGNYFRDGRTKIDFVLVWEIRSRRKRRGKAKSEVVCGEGESVPAEESSRSERRKAQLAQWRDKFVQNLESAGLLMEKEETANEKKTIHFLKISAPWDVLVYYAEELSLRAPLQAQQHLDLNTSAVVLKRLCVPNMMMESVPNRPLDYYTCAFRKSKMSRFLGSEERETYFTNTQRHRIVYEILAQTVYGKRKKAEVGVERLVNEGAYTAAYPLHEGPFQLPSYEIRPDELNQRQVLYYYWARWCKWYKYQPLDHIREYFGEKIALYFAWLGIFIFFAYSYFPVRAKGLVIIFSFCLVPNLYATTFKVKHRTKKRKTV